MRSCVSAPAGNWPLVRTVAGLGTPGGEVSPTTWNLITALARPIIEDEDGTGQTILVEAFSTVTNASAANLPLLFTDGSVEIGCEPAETPANHSASQNRADGVLVTWNAISGPGDLAGLSLEERARQLARVHSASR